MSCIYTQVCIHMYMYILLFGTRPYVAPHCAKMFRGSASAGPTSCDADWGSRGESVRRNWIERMGSVPSEKITYNLPP